VLDAERAEAVRDDLYIALAARSPQWGPILHAGRRAQLSALRHPMGFGRIFDRAAQMRGHGFGESEDAEDPPGDVSVIPAGSVLRVRGDDADEDIYLLSYIATPRRAWLSVAARTSEPRVPRRHASPPSGRNARAQRPREPTFAGNGVTAVDDAGREYELSFGGGGGDWYLGRLTVSPLPPPGISWLEVRCGGQTARLDLTANGPGTDTTVRSVAGSAGEVYLLRRAEGLLGNAGEAEAGLARLAVEVTGLASAVPALRAIGMLPDDSPVPGQLAALIERMGAPGRLIAEPGELPDRWAGVLDSGTRADAGTGSAATDGPGTGGSGTSGGSSAGERDADGSGTVAAAHLTAVLPEANGLSIQLGGMATLPGEGTLIFGGLRTRACEGDGEQSLWLRDDRGGWHAVSVRGWSSSGSGDSSYSFRAAVVPPVGPEVSRVEVYITGGTTEVRAVIPLTWWTK
jgi:hypothetical protein